MSSQPPESPHAPPSSRMSDSRMDSIRKLKIETDKLKLLHKLKLEEEVNTQRGLLRMLNEQIELQR